MLDRPRPAWKRFPSVMVGWDNTARRPQGATLFTGATPDAYRRWLQQTAESVADVREEENYLFIVAWNEWAEGNHLEPDQHFGRAFLEATRAVLVGDTPRPGADRRPPGGPADATASEYEYFYPYEHDSAVANAAALVRDLLPDRHSTVVDLGSRIGDREPSARRGRMSLSGPRDRSGGRGLMEAQGIDAPAT